MEIKPPSSETETSPEISQDKLNSFGGYQKARQLFDAVAEDVSFLQSQFVLSRLLSQQLSSADSVCANIEERYGRGSRKEYIHFLVIARGSARETSGRYERLGHWLPPEIVEKRVALTREIVAILSASILRLRQT